MSPARSAALAAARQFIPLPEEWLATGALVWTEDDKLELSWGLLAFLPFPTDEMLQRARRRRAEMVQAHEELRHLQKAAGSQAVAKELKLLAAEFLKFQRAWDIVLERYASAAMWKIPLRKVELFPQLYEVMSWFKHSLLEEA